jgi:phosphatidylethanolamine/phosphatidyl-N-methylethanolamine N-methyltransferase
MGAQVSREDREGLVGHFYEEYYTKVFGGSGITSWAYRKSHKLLEAPFSSNKSLRILEVGAGQGEHLPFVEADYEQYLMLDLVEPPENPHWQADRRISWEVGDIGDTNVLTGHVFDRVIMTCVLHHVENPRRALLNIERLVIPGGTFSMYLPTDPGLMSRLARAAFIIPKAKRMGFFDYALVNAREHRNHFWGLRLEVEEVFRDWRSRTLYWPSRITAAGANSFSIWQLQKPYR